MRSFFLFCLSGFVGGVVEAWLYNHFLGRRRERLELEKLDLELMQNMLATLAELRRDHAAALREWKRQS